MRVFDFAALSNYESDSLALFTSWSFVHLVAGCALGLVIVLWRNMMAHELLLLLALVLLVLWEVLEFLSNRYDCCFGEGFGAEHFLNRGADIVVGLSGTIGVCFVSGKF